MEEEKAEGDVAVWKSINKYLELTLANPNYDDVSIGSHLPMEFSPCGLMNAKYGLVSSVGSTSVGQVSCSRRTKREKLEMCEKPKSKEAMNLIEKHSCALFGDE
ncbi:hypothetical protein LguiB_030519 [Lonicera macranthoides]